MERTGYILPERSVRHRYLIFLMIATLLLVCGCKKKGRDEAGIGYILSTTNLVYYKSYKSLEWENAKAGSSLFRGDYVRTGDNSSTVLVIEGETIRIEENTLIRIDIRKQLTGGNKGVELVILNGDISLENRRVHTSLLNVTRYRDGKPITEDLNNYIKKIVAEKGSIDTGFYSKQVIKLLSPCNGEVLSNMNNLFRWGDSVSGILTITDMDGKKREFPLIMERERHIELKDGVYEWGIYRDGEIISDSCKFEIRSRDMSLRSVEVRSKRKRDSEINLSEKKEEIPPENKKEASREDIFKNRLSRIDKIIKENIESIKNTKRSIDTAKVKNYAIIYNKLDELNNLLQDLKALQESLFMEIMKIDNPSMIARYLSELEEIESNLKGVSKEIMAIQEEIYKSENGDKR